MKKIKRPLRSPRQLTIDKARLRVLSQDDLAKVDGGGDIPARGKYSLPDKHGY